MKTPAVLESLRARLPPRPRLFRPARPSLAVELSDEYLAVSQAGRGDATELAAYFYAAVPAGAVRSSPVHQNLTNAEELVPLIRAARERLAPGGAPIALCLPDVVVRTAIITAETLPTRPDKLRELVAWRVNKSIPYRMDEADLDWHVFPSRGGGQTLVAVVIRRRILREYEQLFASEDLPVGSVTTSSLMLGERLPPEPEGDVMLINVGCGWFSVLITDGREPIFHRCKPLPENERRGSERDWFVAGELFPTIEYYRTRLGRSNLRRCYVHLAAPGWDELCETLRTTVDVPGLLPAEHVPGLALPDLPAPARGPLGASFALATRGQLRDEPVLAAQTAETS